jgi:hypothetical protein
MQYVWPLITLVSLVFSFSAVYQWIRLTSRFILNVLKRSLILDQLAADSFEEECTCRAYRILVLCY